MMKKLTIVMLSIFISGVCLAQKGKLDGQTFKIRVVEKNMIGKESILKDEITFKDGKVYTKFSQDEEFTDAEYTTEEKDGMITTGYVFKAECTNKKGDKITWEGFVNADEIEGEAVRERKGKIRTIYSFKGTEK